MNYLVVLDKSPKEMAAAVADVHLAPIITTIAKVISTAVQRAVPQEIKPYVNGKGVKRYIAFDQILLPPIKDDRFEPWINWVLAEYNRAWWLITVAWFLDKELGNRFGVQAPLSRYHTMLNDWTKAGMTRVFRKNGIKDWDFPVVLPNQTVPILVEGLAIDTYRQYYKTLQSKTRMKWTGKEKPKWMEGFPVHSNVEKDKCGVCESDADPRMCPVAGCPGRASYNL